MLSIDIKIEQRFSRVKDASDRETFRNLGHAAATIRKEIAVSLVTSDEPSAPGQPPHTKGPMRRALRFDVGKESAVVGPRASVVGESGATHEFGGEYKGEIYPERPFMLPGLEENLDRFAGEWAGSIGE
jgi:phage gpG-like protein